MVERRQTETAVDVDGMDCGAAETDGDSRRYGRDGLWWSGDRRRQQEMWIRMRRGCDRGGAGDRRCWRGRLLSDRRQAETADVDRGGRRGWGVRKEEHETGGREVFG